MLTLVCWYLTHLALRSQPGLLQPGPNALDPACMFWVVIGVSTHTLVLLHQRVVHQAYRGKSYSHTVKKTLQKTKSDIHMSCFATLDSPNIIYNSSK